MRVDAPLMEYKQQNSPEGFAEFVRSKGPLSFWVRQNFWVVSDYQLAQTVLRSDNMTADRSSFFVSRMPEMDLGLIQDFFAVVSKMMVMNDGQTHSKQRRVCYSGFTNRYIETLKPKIQAVIDKGIATLREQGECDFVESFALPIPSTALADFYDISESERGLFYEYSNNMTQFFGGASTYFNEDGMKVNHSASQLRAYFQDLIKLRRAKPGDDFLSILLAHQDHFGVSDEELISQAILMLVAGQLTTTDQMCNNLFEILTREGVSRDPEGLEIVIEEASRLDPAVTFIFRVCKEDMMLGDQLIKAGDVMFISCHAVNRDPEVFPNPHQIDLNNTAKHLSFGYGGHFCLGAKLGRMEMLMCLKSLFQAFPNLKLDRAASRRSTIALPFQDLSTYV